MRMAWGQHPGGRAWSVVSTVESQHSGQQGHPGKSAGPDADSQPLPADQHLLTPGSVAL